MSVIINLIPEQYRCNQQNLPRILLMGATIAAIVGIAAAIFTGQVMALVGFALCGAISIFSLKQQVQKVPQQQPLDRLFFEQQMRESRTLQLSQRGIERGLQALTEQVQQLRETNHQILESPNQFKKVIDEAKTSAKEVKELSKEVKELSKAIVKDYGSIDKLLANISDITRQGATLVEEKEKFLREIRQGHAVSPQAPK